MQSMDVKINIEFSEYPKLCRENLLSLIKEPNTKIHDSHPKKVNILFNYPLQKDFIFTLEQETPITYKNLVEFIKNKYIEIYNMERETASNQTWTLPDGEIFVGKILPIELRIKKGGLRNRHRTNGIYGIWGHDFEDLVLEVIEYNIAENLITMFIGS